MAAVQNLNMPGENRLLASLSCRDQVRLLPQLEKLSLNLRDVLYNTNQPIEYVYFPLHGVMSLVLEMKNGATVEVGTIGNEGMVGTPVFLGAEKSPTKAFAQVPGDALRMEVAAFKKEMQRNGPLEDLIRRYTQAMVNQISQSVACNHLHCVEQRMARWLLMTQDRMGTDQFSLTQEFLAQMLGVRRPSVSVVAALLQQKGLIQYHRGRMTVLDRAALEALSCECYQVVKKEFDRLLG